MPRKTHPRPRVAHVLVLLLLAGGVGPAAAAQDDDADALQIPFYTGTILPTPQKAAYYDEFLDLSDVGVLLGTGLRADDPRLALLKERIARLGGRAAAVRSPAAARRLLICLGDTPPARGVEPPDKAEGYVIRWLAGPGRPLVALKGRDRLGLLWAVSSLNQLMTDRAGKPVLRKADVYDYPVYHHRGFITGYIPSVRQWAQYVTAFKFNVLAFYRPFVVPFDKMLPQWNVSRSSRGYDPAYWRKPPPPAWLAAVKELGTRLTPLGIQWYMGLSPIRGKPEQKIDSKSDKDFDTIMRILRPVAAAGGGFHFHYDDTRFPMNPADVRNFGSAREADVFFFNRVYAATKKECPYFKMTICPPFYWGPQYEPLSYGESRDAYLRAMGERLPKGIGIYWTGRAVWGGKVKKSEVKWITDRIKRKPWFWQNGSGLPHMYGYHYYTDPVDIWPHWHYDGFYRDVNFTWPTGGKRGTVFMLTMVDYLWNPAAHDPKRAVQEAAKKLLGPKTWPALVKMNRCLSKLDAYEWKISVSALRNIAQIEKDVAAIVAAERECLKVHPGALNAWTSTTYRVERAQRFLRQLKARAKRGGAWAVFTRNVDALKRLAQKEAGYVPARDTFLSPYDFRGGKSPAEYGFKCEKRLATWIYGAKTDLNTLTASFRLNGPPTRAGYDLVLSAQDDDSERKCRIRILVNHNLVFAGPNPFVRFGWYRHTFPIKGSFLKEGANTIQIANIENSDRRKGPPFFMLNYAALLNAPPR